ncbi:major histocompatibility complex class I-related gene protein-like isoform X2 [Sphaeramia orbicularis]|uniref:Major histocompatibility complex class I-related gene protein-like n=2 Tax=Sphaeramia orbicularis TaxID=375764 RepID=A0A672Z7D1_9TELE|nr:major histocompatibility complex class I-related gene protein-like isoform X2 [Sphaeramia orbicularis]
MMTKMYFFLLICHAASSAKHSLVYRTISYTGVSNFPEFQAVKLVSNVKVAYCDNNIMTTVITEDWMKKYMEDHPDILQLHNKRCIFSYMTFGRIIDDVIHSLNLTEDAHVFQSLISCEWETQIREMNCFGQLGFDGKDFLTYDLNTKKLCVSVPRFHKHKIPDYDQKDYSFTVDNLVPYLLKEYVEYANSSLPKTEFLSVSLLQTSPSSPVTCHATGFYPHRAVMFWRKDGEEVHEGVEHGEILPNNDGTFQMSVDLNVSSITPEDWGRFDCVFQLADEKNDIVTRLDTAVIRTNGIRYDRGSRVVVGLLLLIFCIVGLVIWRRKNTMTQQWVQGLVTR